MPPPTESETSSLFTITDSIAQDLFRHVPGSTSKYQSLNEHYYWPYDSSMKHYERLSLQFQGQLAGGSTWWEPPARKGALERLMNDAGEEAKVLDVGCGVLGLWSSAMSVEFPQAEVIGIDLVPTEIEWAPPNLSFEVWDVVQGLPFRDSDFDVIRAASLAFFLPDYSFFLSECLRCLKPNGILLLSEPEGRLHNGNLTMDWFALQNTVSPAITQPKTFPILKDLVVAARAGFEFEDSSFDLTSPNFTSGGLRFQEIFEHSWLIPVGATPGLTPSEAAIANIKRQILLLLWRNQLLDPEANKAQVCEQLEIVERLVAEQDRSTGLMTGHKVVWARKGM